MRTCLMRSRGFTLIELLVVIAIIALLIGLMLPGSATAEMVTTASNASSVGLASDATVSRAEAATRTWVEMRGVAIDGVMHAVEWARHHNEYLFLALLLLLSKLASRATWREIVLCVVVWLSRIIAHALELPLRMCLSAEQNAKRSIVRERQRLRLRPLATNANGGAAMGDVTVAWVLPSWVGPDAIPVTSPAIPA